MTEVPILPQNTRAHSSKKIKLMLFNDFLRVYLFIHVVNMKFDT